MVSNLNVLLGECRFVLNAYVYPLKSYGLILGFTWFRRFNPVISWQSGVVFIRNKMIKPGWVRSDIMKEFDFITSKIKKPYQIYLIKGEAVGTVGHAPKEHQILQNFKDVFKNELNELPPERKICHKIETCVNFILLSTGV